MNLRKIKALDMKIRREAQAAVDAIYKANNSLMVELITQQVPKGHTLWQGNGVVVINNDVTGKEIKGKAWGMSTDNEQLDMLASIQYRVEYNGNYDMPTKIKGIK